MDSHGRKYLYLQPKHLLSKLRELYPAEICAPIHFDEHFTNAPSYGQTIFEFAPDCDGANDYRELVKTVSGRDDLF